jgi:hypothetical protein
MRPLRLIAAVALIVLAAMPGGAGAATRKVPARWFGTMWDKAIQDSPADFQDAQFATMAKSGVESTRSIFAWNLAQPDEGQPPSFALTDQMVRNGAAHGIEILPVVTQAPTWARVQPNELGSAPSNYQAYDDYLTALIDRYGPSGSFWDENPSLPFKPLRVWQIWNEPNILYQWSPQADWEIKYGQLLKGAYAAVKQADPGAKVALAGLPNASWTDLDSLYDRGGVKGSFDIAAVHYYSKIASQFIQVSRMLRASLDKHGDKKIPIWWTEAGGSASQGRISSPGNEHFQTTDKGLADVLTKSYKLFYKYRSKLRIQRVYWYNWASSYSTSGGAFDFSGMSVFDGQKTSAKPALVSYRKIARSYEGCKKDARARCLKR